MRATNRSAKVVAVARGAGCYSPRFRGRWGPKAASLGINLHPKRLQRASTGQEAGLSARFLLRSVQ